MESFHAAKVFPEVLHRLLFVFAFFFIKPSVLRKSRSLIFNAIVIRSYSASLPTPLRSLTIHLVSPIPTWVWVSLLISSPKWLQSLSLNEIIAVLVIVLWIRGGRGENRSVSVARMLETAHNATALGFGGRRVFSVDVHALLSTAFIYSRTPLPVFSSYLDF